MTEKWVDIKGYEGIYQISSHGRVKRLAHTAHYRREPGSRTPKTYSYDEMYIKPHENSAGYLRVTLWKNQEPKRFFVHRLVANYFVDRGEGREVINHIDGDKKNNHYKNLEWVTRSENSRHALELGLYTPNTKGINFPRPVIQLDKNTGEVINEFETISDAFRETGVHHISSVCRGERKTAGGYVWKYRE